MELREWCTWQTDDDDDATLGASHFYLRRVSRCCCHDSAEDGQDGTDKIDGK